MDHPVEILDHLVLICQQGIIQRCTLSFLDILGLAGVGVQRVYGDTYKFYSALGKLILGLGEGAQFRGTNWRIVGRV